MVVCRLCADLLPAMDCSRLTVGKLRIWGSTEFSGSFVCRLCAFFCPLVRSRHCDAREGD